ncbi:MAG: hypothetical protein JRN45_10855 [Nitrososphaerota archaeon]|nr:hypothetical protein [Nitrososphaerota archaeon]
MKRTPLVLAAICLLLVPCVLPEVQTARATQPPASDALLPPVSISLTAIPSQLPPGGSGVVIVQLVDVNGNPSPARQDIAVRLYSSDSAVADVAQQVTVPFGKSHAEAQVDAGIQGSAKLTATADGFLSGSAQVSTLLFNDFALQLDPMNNQVSPGDTLHLRVRLTASGMPFETPAGVQVSVVASLQGVPQQSVEVQSGSSDAYFSILVPSNLSLATPYLSITAAASGFTSATAAAGLSPQGANPQEVMVGPPNANLTARSTEFLSVSLLNATFAPAEGTVTLSLFSSNSSVVEPLSSQVVLSSEDSAVFPVYANATGTAQVTAIAPGLVVLPLTIRVVGPLKPTLSLSVPPEMRVGEAYSFSVGFYLGTQPVPYGPATVYISSSNAGVTVPSSVEVSALGYAIGTLAAGSANVANITAVLEGSGATTAAVSFISAPVIAPVQYTVRVFSDSGPLAGVPVNFTYGGRTAMLDSDQSGVAVFGTFNDSATAISVPEQIQPSEQTRYTFVGIGTSTGRAINVTASAPVNFTARYATYYQFRVVSQIGNTTGSGWYRSGTSATYSIDETSSGGPLIYQRFSGWTGSFSSDQASGSTVITSPAFITAQWNTDSSLLLASVGAALAGAAVVGLFIFRLKKRLPAK